MKYIYQGLERLIFDVRYVLMVGYAALSLGVVAYMFYIVKSAYTFIDYTVTGEDGDRVIVAGLELLDNVMVANVMYLILAGSFLVYVKDKLSDFTFRKHEERPIALQHLGASGLKEKMAASLVGVTSVYLVQVLVQTTLENHNINWYALAVLLGIHLALIVGMLAFKAVAAEETEHHREEAKKETHSEIIPAHS